MINPSRTPNPDRDRNLRALRRAEEALNLARDAMTCDFDTLPFNAVNGFDLDVLVVTAECYEFLGRLGNRIKKERETLEYELGGQI